jgi:hypothetical protein
MLGRGSWPTRHSEFRFHRLPSLRTRVWLAFAANFGEGLATIAARGIKMDSILEHGGPITTLPSEEF